MSLILSGSDGLSDVDGSAATPAIRGTDANTGMFFPAADTIAFSEGGVESMRIDSAGNVGIGSSAVVAGYRLDVRGAAYLQTTANPTNAQLISLTNQTTTSNNGCRIGFDAFNIGAASIGIPSNDAALAFYVNGVNTERMRINSSGNVGIGGAPSYRLDVQGTGTQTIAARSVTSGDATLLLEASGVNSGTINYLRSTSAMTFSNNGAERMRIDTNGNVGINNITPSSYGNLVIGNTSGGASQIGMLTTTTSFAIQLSNSTAGGTTISNSWVTGGQGPLKFVNATVENMRIAPAGQVLIGTTSTGGFGTNIAARICSPAIGSGAAFGIGSAQLPSTSVVNTGLPINQFSAGGTVLMIASRHTDSGTNTLSAVYMIQFYYDGNNAPNPVLIAGSAFLTFGVSGGNLTVQNAAGGDCCVSWFTNK
jgi:hypothetical protein